MSVYDKIVNPLTGKKVNINGKLGQNILKNYKNMINYNTKFSKNQAGGAHQLQRMIAALLVEGNLTHRGNFGIIYSKSRRHQKSKHNMVLNNFNSDEKTARVFTDGKYEPVYYRKDPGTFLPTSYSGRGANLSYSQRRQMIQKIKHSADMTLNSNDDKGILEDNEKFFLFYDPTNSFSVSAQRYLDDYIIDYVLNIEGTADNSDNKKLFNNIFHIRPLYVTKISERGFESKPINKFFTSRYRNQSGTPRCPQDTTNKRYNSSDKRMNSPLMYLGSNYSEGLSTIKNFPAFRQIWVKYGKTFHDTTQRSPWGGSQQSRELTEDDWAKELINYRSKAYNTNDLLLFEKAWSREEIIREIYLVSIINALNKIKFINPHYIINDSIIKLWKDLENSHNVLLKQGTNPPRNITFREFKRNKERLLRREPTADDKKTIIKEWTNMLSEEKRRIFFNKIYNLNINYRVFDNRKAALSSSRNRERGNFNETKKLFDNEQKPVLSQVQLLRQYSNDPPRGI